MLPRWHWAYLVAQMVKNLPAKQETWVQSLSREDTLEKGLATHSGILAWRIPWTEEPGGLQSMGSQRVRHNWVANIFSLSQVAPVVKNLPANSGDIRDLGLIPGSGRSPGEENSNLLQYTFWRNPWTKGPGRLQSIGLQGVGYNWSDLAHMHPHD